MEKLQKGIIFIALLIALFVFYKLIPILTPFCIAALLAYLADPSVNYLQKYKIPRTLAVVIVFVVIILLCLGIFLLILPIIFKQLNLLADRLPVVINWIQKSIVPWLSAHLDHQFNFNFKQLHQSMGQALRESSLILPKIVNTITASGLALLGWVTNLLLIPVVTFYLLRDWGTVINNAAKLLPRSMEPTVKALCAEGNEVLGAFFRGQLLVMLSLGIIYAIGLWTVGLQFAVLVGLIAGLASIVPYMGFIVGIICALAIGWFQFGDIQHLVYIIIVFLIGQAAEGMALTPLLVGDRIGLHPVAVIFAALAGGYLFGFVGVLLALPVAAVIMVLLRFAKCYYMNTELYTES